MGAGGGPRVRSRRPASAPRLGVLLVALSKARQHRPPRQEGNYIKRENTVRTAPGFSDEARPASRARARPARRRRAATPLKRRARTTLAATTPSQPGAAWRRPATPRPHRQLSTWPRAYQQSCQNRRVPTPRGGPTSSARAAGEKAPGTSGSSHKSFLR